MLRDLLPDAPMEKMVLVTAAEDRLAERMAGLLAQGLPAGTAIAMAAEHLAAHTGLTSVACEWVSRETAVALGYLAPSDLPPREAAQPAWQGGGQGLGAPATPSFGTGRPVGSTDVTIVPPPKRPSEQPGGFGGQQPGGFGGEQAGGFGGEPPQQPGGFDSPQGQGWLDQPGQGGFGGQQPVAPYPPGSPYGPPPAAGRPPGSRRKAKILAASATAVVAAVAVVLVLVLLPGHGPEPKPPPAKPTVHIFHVNSGPISIALDGGHAWVSQTSPDRLAELNATTGSPIREEATGLLFPWHIAAGGGNVWIANDGKDPGFVSKFSESTGAFTKITGSSSGVANPTAVAVLGNRVWVANLGTQTKTGFTGYGSVTELDAGTGAVIKSFVGTKDGITYPVALAVSGPYLWVVDSGYHGGLGGVTRIDSRNGSTLTKNGTDYGFERPSSIAASGGRIWVLNDPYRGRLSVTEINASDGSFIRRLSGPQYDFGMYVHYLQYRPEGIAASGDRVWVADPVGGSEGHGAVTEINAKTGALVRVLSGSPYNFYTPDALVASGSDVWVSSFGPKNLPGWVTVLRSFK